MLGVLAVVVPLGLAGAFSPMMLTEQTVLLAGPDGRRVAGRYAAGAALTLLTPRPRVLVRVALTLTGSPTVRDAAAASARSQDR